MLDVCVGIEWIDIVHCRQMCRIRLLNIKAAADRFCCFDDALDDLVPTRRFDGGIVDCRDQIAAAV